MNWKLDKNRHTITAIGGHKRSTFLNTGIGDGVGAGKMVYRYFSKDVPPRKCRYFSCDVYTYRIAMHWHRWPAITNINKTKSIITLSIITLPIITLYTFVFLYNVLISGKAPFYYETRTYMVFIIKLPV